jgi:hypothetical protein
MAEALEQVLELFRAKEWKFEVDEENDLVHTGIEGDNGDWRVIAGASDDDHVFLMLSLFPQKCPAPKRAACAELLTRINFGMKVGCFEMDFESGRIHFKTAVPFAQGALDPEILNKVVMFNLGSMDRFLPAIMSVVYAGIPPAKALAAVEHEEKAKEQAKAKRRDKQQETVRRRFLDN